MIATGLMGASGLLAWNSISAARSAKPRSWVPEATRWMAPAPLAASIHIQTGLFEIAFLLGVDKQGCSPSKRQSSWNLSGVSAAWAAPQLRAAGRGGLKKGSFAHMTPWFIDGEGTAACAQDRCQCVYKA
jgi:hypothetical protein